MRTPDLSDAALAAIADAVEGERLAAGMGQTELAEQAGIHRATISKIENGQPVGRSSYIAVEKAFGWERDRLLNIGRQTNGAVSVEAERIAALEQDVQDLRRSVVRLQETFQRALDERAGREPDEPGPPVS